MALPEQDGLRWKDTLFDVVPEWTRKPSVEAIEKVCRQQLSIPPDESCEVVFHASGLFNKLYNIRRANSASLIMRVTLPVYPHHKTRAEVATLRWVRDNTSIPVSEIFAFDDTNNNEIGFEWILMELMHGTPAHTRWWDMSMEQKVAFTKQMAKFQAELCGFQKADSLFRNIGTLDICSTPDDVKGSKAVAPGLLVSHEFFMGDHLHYDIPRGPFRSSHDWLSTKLDIILQHQTAVLKNSEDEDEREDAEDISAVVSKLLALVPKVFAQTLEEPETTSLYHHDLHLNNILVNEHSEITGVLDWECVSAVPIWMSAKLPKYLEGPVRKEEPHKETYGDLEERGEDSLYFIHRMEYDATYLRKVYKARLKELWPEWPLEESHAEIDLFEAIEHCDGIFSKRVGRWADRVLDGDMVRFDISNPR